MPCSAPSSASVFTSPSTPCLAETYAGLVRRRDEPVHGGDGDERARRPTSASASHAYLASRNGLSQHHGEHRVPAVLGEVGHRRDVLQAGVGDDDVEAAEALDAPRRPPRGWRPAWPGRPRTASPGPSGSGLRSTARTAIPAPIKPLRIARPIPLAAPVTSAARPSRRAGPVSSVIALCYRVSSS